MFCNNMVRNNLRTQMRVLSMDTGCLEVVVNTKTNTLMKVLQYIAIVLAVCFCLLIFIVHIAFAVPMTGCLAAVYFTWLECVVDYEYAYVDKEIRIAKIQQKQRRKEIGVYDLTKMEVMAPSGSSHLDMYKGRNLDVLDYSSGDDSNLPYRYEIILDGGKKLILDLTGEYGEQIVTVIRSFSPRKVFTN